MQRSETVRTGARLAALGVCFALAGAAIAPAAARADEKEEAKLVEKLDKVFEKVKQKKKATGCMYNFISAVVYFKAGAAARASQEKDKEEVATLLFREAREHLRKVAKCNSISLPDTADDRAGDKAAAISDAKVKVGRMRAYLTEAQRTTGTDPAGYYEAQSWRDVRSEEAEASETEGQQQQ